ncbi:MAG: hypothetical protein HYY93_12020, partial [Planctomycetes bacterium]|nr:hypothetical protein [Planctomycetota bacterium]
MTIRFAPRTTGLLLASLLLAPELLQAQNGFMDRNTGAPPPEYASQGQTDVFLASFKIGNASGTTTSVTSITFTNAGTLPMTSVSNWRLFNSATRPIIGAATALGTVSTTATTVTFSSIAGASTGTNSNNGIKFWVYGDIATGATIGQTLKLSLNANTDVTYSPVLASNGSRATPVRAGIDTGIFDQSTTTILKSGSPATGFAHIVYERDNPPEIALIPGEARVRLGSFRCYADAGNATLSSVTFSNTAVSLLADTNITRVRLYTDDNAGPEDGATLIGAGSFSGDVITFSGLSTTFTTTPSWLHVQADISPSAPVGQSFKLDILAAGDVTFSAGTSGLDAATTPATTGAPVCRVATFKRVIAAGGGDYTTLGAAITAIPAVLTSPWVIEVQDGATYSENVTISGKTASAQNPIWLRAGLGYAPKIASNPTTANNTLLVSGVTDVKVSGFDISGSTGTTGTYGVVAAIASSHRVVFERLYVHNGASGIRVDTTNDWTIRNCVISKIFVGTNAYTSIVANSASRGRYYNNTWVHDGEGTTAVFLATEAHGFYNSLSSDVTVRNSLFRFRPYTKSGGGVTYVAFYLSGGAASDGFSSDFNYVYNVNNASAIAQHIYWGRIATYSSTSALWLQYTGDEKYSVTGFELISAFVDPANGDYHLKSTSGHWASAGFVTDGTDGEGSIARQTAASPTMDVSSSDPPHAGDYFLAPYNYYHRQQPSNGVIALRASTTTTASVSAGATTISVADTAKFSIGTGTGRGVIEGDDFSYTGTSVASGPGNLTGVAGVSVAHPTIGTQIVSDGRGPELGAFGNCEQASLAGGSYGGTKVWNGSIDTNWDTAGNWTPSGAPGSSDTVFIPSAGSAPTLSSALPQIRTLGISGHTLTISSSVAPPFITGAFEYQLFMPWRTSRVIMGSVTVVTGVLAMPSGAIDFGGDLRTYPTTPGALNLTGGSISFSGTVRQSIDLGAAESFNTLTFLAATPAAETWSSFAVKGNFSLARSLLQSNSAKVTLDGTGPQALNVNAAGVSFGGDLIVNQTPASTVTVGGSNPGITVGGTLTVTSGTLTLSGANSSFNVTLDGGTINQSSGTASFGGTVTASSGALQNTGATWTFGGGSTLTLSGGTVVATGGTTNLNGTVGASTGILRCSGGGMNVANALTVSGALLDVTGGTLTLSNGLTVSSGAFSASTGTVNFNSGFGLTIGSAGVWTAGSAGAPTFTRSDATTYSILCQGTASISALNLQNLNGTGLKFGTNTIAGDSDTVAATITSGYNARIDGGSSYWITFENATGASGQRNGAGSDGEVWDVDPFDSDFPALPGSAAPVSTGQIRWVYYRWKWLGEVNTSWGDTSGTPLAANWEKDGIRASSMPFFPDTSTDDVYIVLGVPPSFRNCNIDGVGVTRTVRSLTQASGTFSIPATNNLIVYGDFYKSSAGTFGPAPGVELRFPTSTDQRLTVVGGGSYNFGLRVWKTGGTLTLGSSLSTVGVFDMTGGAFDIGGNTLTVNNTLTVANGATLKMLSAGGVLKEDATYSGDYTIAGALSMGSNARVDLSASSGDLTLSGTGALSMTGTSMLTGGTGTTALNGTVTLTGSVTIRVPAAAWLTFSGAFTATAASGSPTLTTVSGRMNNLAFNTGASLNVNGLNVSAHPTGGMSIASGCTLTRFDDVAFTNAANGGSHLAITGGSYTLTASGCSFDSTFGGIGYNVDASSMAGGTITFSQPQGAGAGETYDNDPAEPGGNRILFARTLRWVGNWRYRIEIGSELTISETVGETICVQFDPKTTPTAAALLGGTEAVTGADDLRVVYYDDSAAPGYQYTELARQVVGDHTTFTSSIMLQIYFAMPVSFAVGDRVWLYYGNAAPSPAPTASLLTQRFKDDFEDGTLNAWNAGSTKATNSTLANWQRTRGLALDDSAGGDGLIVKSTTGVPEIVEAAIQGTAKATSMRFELTDTNESGGIALTATNVMYLNGSGIYVDFSPVVPYAAATWYHVRLVFHAPNQYDIYVDGNLVRSNSATFAGAFTPQITFGNTGGATPDLYADNVTAWSGSIAAVLNVFGTEGGVVGTTTSEWEDPFNWTDGATPAGLGPPTSSDDAVIDGGYTYAPLLADLTNHFCLGLDIGRTSISLLNFNGGGSIVAGGNVTIGPFGTVDATGDNGDLSVGGDYANNGTFTPGSTTLAMDGSHFQALNGGSAAQRTVFHFRVNNTGVAGNNTATALGGFDINGNLLILAGKFDPGSFTHTVGGDWDDSGGSFTPTAGTIELDGGVARTLMTIAANNFWNLTLASSTPISFAPGSDLTLDVDGDLVVASMSALDMWDGTNPAVLDVEGNLSLGAGGSLNPRTSTAHDVGGDWFDFDGTFTPTAGTITLSSSGSSTISVGSTNNFFNLTVSNPGTTSFAAGSDLTLDVNGLLVVDAGTLDMTDGTSDVAFDVAVDLYISSGGTLNPRGSTAHNVAGNWDDSGGAFTPTAGTVTLSDADGSTIKSAAANNFFNLTVSNAGTTLFDPATDPVLDVNGSLAVSGGTLDMKAGGTDVSLDVEGNLTLSGAGILDPRGSTTHDVAGNWDAFTPIAGRITLSDADGSTIDVASGNNFFDLTVSNAGTTSFATGSDLVLDVNGDLLVSGGTLDMQDGAAAAVALDVEGNLTLSGGVTTILDPRASTAHDVAGNWDDSGGTFQQAAGKITLSDTDGSTIKVAAANYFNGLTIDNTGTTSMDAATPDGIDVRGNFTVQGGTFEFGDDSHAIGDAAADLFLISSLGIVEMGTSTVTCLADIDVIGTGVPELRFTAGAATLKMGPSQLLRVGNGFAAWAGKLVCSGAGTVSTITTSGFVGVNLWGLTVTNFSTLSVNKAGTAGDRLRILSHSPGGVQIDSGAILNNGTAGEAKGIAFDNMVNSGTDDTYLVFNSTGAENFILRNCSFDAAACDHNVSVAVAFFGTVRMYGTTGTKGTEAFEDDPVGTGVTTPGRILWPVTLSGVVRQVDETSPLTGIAMDVSALVNGGASPDDTQPVNTGTGAFSVQAITLTGDVLTLFIDNHARKGVIVTTSNSVPISGLNLIEDRLVVRNDSFSVTTNVDLDTGHNGDADLTALYADGGAPGQTLDVAAGKILYLEGGTYRPGIGSGTVNTPALRVAGGALSLATADYTVNVTNASYFFELSSGSVTIDSAGDLLNADGDISILGGGLTMSAGLITCAGNWDDTAASGAFNPTGGTVRMDSVGVSKDISQRTAATANSFYDLDIAATASTIGAFTPIAVTNNLTKYMGGDYDTRGNTHTIAGRLIVNAGTFIMNSLGDVTASVSGTGDAGA